ncbi:hypothetical protein CDV36_007644 [Fusarium kuroshium]|uniref:Uncharacterized protein n=1 Tax=Fusarium kuroshium TaxID=2010991 RepID=A0A3M2S576_9HYPO|nr:hypothetical protein CDV36_007644 [Fusarium kuroshium]
MPDSSNLNWTNLHILRTVFLASTLYLTLDSVKPRSNPADCPTTDSIEENECQPETSGDNDAGLKAEDEICHAREKVLEVSPGVESPSHPNENAAGGDREFSQLGTIILGEIRDKFLFMVGAVGTKDTSERFVINMGASPFYIMVKGNKKRELKWSPGRERLSNEVVDAIRGAWPRHRNVKGVEQIILESDGTTPARLLRPGKVQERRTHVPSGPVGKCAELRRTVSFTTIRMGSYGLFNIFILADEYMSPTAKDWNLGLEGELNEPNWALYGLKPCGRGTAITHYMFEVSRVLERSLDSWSDALTWIDTLVHVNLSDFEDAKHVEDLMFDKSFTRSKDYFVAIQLLRIMDEWLDELLLGIEDLRSCLAMKHPIFCVDEAQDNINVAIKSMKERTTRFQGRVRKKSEEIKSLRDGLFNATSLREATKAMALNQAIYIFTVVTVLFTPVSFLATFWALPFLNNPVEEGSDMVPEPKAFRSSFIAMPLLTYTLVIGIAWYMRPNQSRYTVPVWLVDMWDITREVLDSAWEKISLKGKRTQRNSQEGYDTEEDV